MRNACGQQGAVIWGRALSLNLSVLKLTFIFKRASFCFVKTQFSLPLVLGLSEGNEAKKATMEVWCVRVIPWHGEYGSNNVILEFVGVHEDEADERPVEHTQDKKNLKIFNWLCEPDYEIMRFPDVLVQDCIICCYIHLMNRDFSVLRWLCMRLARALRNTEYKGKKIDVINLLNTSVITGQTI